MLNQIDLSRIDLNLLVLFDTVMRERHVGRSAQKLNLTASAVSHGLKRMRALLGDPLFLKHPRGVVPTQRSTDIEPLVHDILARVSEIVATAEPFDPAHSQRRFVIAAPDGVASVFLSPLLSKLSAAPGIQFSLRQLLPRPDEPTPALAWNEVLQSLDSRDIDIAVLPGETFPSRFRARPLYAERFVIAMNAGHPERDRLDLSAYCRARHMVVSHSGDPFGFVDTSLAELGLSRRVALTVPNFMFALAVLAESNLVAALPERFLLRYADRFGLVAVAPPLELPVFPISVVVPHAALMDSGLAWMVDQIH
jgi:DNA-binding transcriptional LysR family regulator